MNLTTVQETSGRFSDLSDPFFQFLNKFVDIRDQNAMHAMGHPLINEKIKKDRISVIPIHIYIIIHMAVLILMMYICKNILMRFIVMVRRIILKI
jgi:hypothetical protein